MSERIKSIANEFFSTPPNQDELEQFSTYLIKYCAAICNTVSGDRVDDASRDYQEGRAMGAEICRDQILKYFQLVLFK